ncbi:MAG: hypothetical protein CME66_11460 [Halobacteriovoraceae bacterium]|jgi:hypothetical protein|nr:hypothetical protein [Halobacteriovoraceae bacterium]
MNNEKTMTHKLWDKIGICASGLCLVHCLATPILLLLFPATTMSGLIDSHLFHIIFAFIVVSSIFIAVYPNCHKHGHKDIIALAIIGAGLILSALFLHDFPIIYGHGLTMLGSILLIIAHLKNMKVRHGKCENDETHCSH